jgi:hypothetical protein
MNNRLGDIPKWAQDDSDDEDVPNPTGNSEKGGDVEMGQMQPKFMDNFFREVDSIKADIDAVGTATKSIGEINEKSLQATTTEEENDLSKRLRPLIDSTNKRAKRTKTLLGLLKEETVKLKAEENINQSDLRCVRIVFNRTSHVGMCRVVHCVYLSVCRGGDLERVYYYSIFSI